MTPVHQSTTPARPEPAATPAFAHLLVPLDGSSVADELFCRAPSSMLVLRPPRDDGPAVHAGADVRPEPSTG